MPDATDSASASREAFVSSERTAVFPFRDLLLRMDVRFPAPMDESMVAGLDGTFDTGAVVGLDSEGVVATGDEDEVPEPVFGAVPHVPS